MRVALIKNGIVSNIIIADLASYQPETGVIAVDGSCADFGWLWNGMTFTAPSPNPAFFDAAAIKAECQKRIYAVASPNCQMNMTAYVAGDLANPQDKKSFINSLSWVQAMRGVCLGLIAGNATEFSNDSLWPICPDDVIVLASKF